MTIRIQLRVLVALVVLSGIVNIVNIRIAAQWRARAVDTIEQLERCTGRPAPAPARGAMIARP